MSLLDQKLDTYIPPVLVPAGEERELEITKCWEEEASTGRIQMKVSYQVLGDEEYEGVFDNFNYAVDGDTEKNLNFFRGQINAFLATFKIEACDADDDGVFSDFKGKTGWAILGVKVHEGKESNVVTKYIAKK